MSFSTRFVAFAFLASAAAAHAQFVAINPDPADVTGDPLDGSLVAHARYRVDKNNWDMLFDHDRTPGNKNDLGTLNIGNVANMSGRWYDFSLQFDPKSAFTFSIIDRDTGLQNTIRWERDLPSAFNVLSLESRALGTGNQSRALDLTDLKLSFQDFAPSVSGEFGDLSVASEKDPKPVNSVKSAYAMADFNLGSVAWMLTGSFKPTVIGNDGNPQEALRLYIDVRQSSATVCAPAIPEPGTLLLVAAGLPLLGIRRPTGLIA